MKGSSPLSISALSSSGVMRLPSSSLTNALRWRWRHRRDFLKELEVARITPEELKAEMERGEEPFIVDLRHPLDFLAYPYTIGRALRISPAELEQRHQEIPRDRDVILYCT